MFREGVAYRLRLCVSLVVYQQIEAGFVQFFGSLFLLSNLHLTSFSLDNFALLSRRNSAVLSVLALLGCHVYGFMHKTEGLAGFFPILQSPLSGLV